MSQTYSLTVDRADVDLVADVILWEMWRAGDIGEYEIAEARKVALTIITAQRSGNYPHRYCRPDDQP